MLLMFLIALGIILIAIIMLAIINKKATNTHIYITFIVVVVSLFIPLIVILAQFTNITDGAAHINILNNSFYHEYFTDKYFILEENIWDMNDMYSKKYIDNAIVLDLLESANILHQIN